MRWIPFIILVYLVVLFQSTAGKVLTLTTAGLGSVGPDLAALVAVFVALYARSCPDAMLAAWVLGMAVDLTVSGGVGAATVVGPMSLAYALAAGALFRIREAFFRERALTQGLLALGFCLLAHGVWVTAQSLLAAGEVSWSAYGRTLLQAAALACYTAALMPLAHFGLIRCQRWLLVSPVGRGGRGGR
jgi:cell shape-determining protein MreD